MNLAREVPSFPSPFPPGPFPYIITELEQSRCCTRRVVMEMERTFANLKYVGQQENLKNSSPAAKPMLAQESAGSQLWHNLNWQIFFLCV